jgi:hypothetical protein
MLWKAALGNPVMILVGSALKGFAIEASDGRIGTVSDFLFDDQSWQIRWMVVQTGGWLDRQKVLIHPSVIGPPDYHRNEITVRLSKQKVKDSPGILSDSPVSQQMQTDLYGYYGWDPLWGGSNYLDGYTYGMGSTFLPVPHDRDTDLLETGRSGSRRDDGDPHLRSLTAVVSYHIEAKDGAIGHVENFLIDDETWAIRYLIVDTRSWWPGQHVLISPYAVRAIDWSGSDVSLDVTREQVRGAPPWDPVKTIDRESELRLHGYYGWPGYGW